MHGFTVALEFLFVIHAEHVVHSAAVDIVLTLDVCLYVTALERKRLIGMT